MNLASKKYAPERKHDPSQCTRWPLLLEDVPIPEWTLEDDVAVIASRVTEFDEVDPDHPFYVPYLTSITVSLLSTIFSLLAKHTPARSASMQNRIEPLNWRSVFDVLVNCDNSEFANLKYVFFSLILLLCAALTMCDGVE